MRESHHSDRLTRITREALLQDPVVKKILGHVAVLVGKTTAPADIAATCDLLLSTTRESNALWRTRYLRERTAASLAYIPAMQFLDKAGRSDLMPENAFRFEISPEPRSSPRSTDRVVSEAGSDVRQVNAPRPEVLRPGSSKLEYFAVETGDEYRKKLLAEIHALMAGSNPADASPSDDVVSQTQIKLLGLSIAEREEWLWRFLHEDYASGSQPPVQAYELAMKLYVALGQTQLIPWYPRPPEGAKPQEWVRIVGEVVEIGDREPKMRVLRLRNSNADVRALGLDDRDMPLPALKGLDASLPPVLSVGSMYALERSSDTDAWRVVECVGEGGELLAELRARAYKIHADPVPTEEVQSETRAIEATLNKELLGGSSIIHSEIARGAVDVTEHPSRGRGSWQARCAEKNVRADFRNVLTITIDPPTAKDFDDAISWRLLPDGTSEIGVHIADVSHFVKEGSAIDRDAIAKQFTAYLPGAVSTMLPEVLANQLCSLNPSTSENPHNERLAVSVAFRVNTKTGEVVDEEPWVGEAIIKSDHRLTYDEAAEILEKETPDQGKERLKEMIGVLKSTADRQRIDRRARGAVFFPERPEPGVVYAQGKISRIEKKWRNVASFLIEDLMIRANGDFANTLFTSEIAAAKDRTLGANRSVALPLREHRIKDVGKLVEIARGMLAEGIISRHTMRAIEAAYKTVDPSDPDPLYTPRGKNAQKIPVATYIMEKIVGDRDRLTDEQEKAIDDEIEERYTPDGVGLWKKVGPPGSDLIRKGVLRKEMRKSAQEAAQLELSTELSKRISRSGRIMEAARFVTVDPNEDQKGHAGLAMLYTQATSPIRRWWDIFVHREIKRFIARERGADTLPRGEEYLRDVSDRGNARKKLVDAAEVEADRLCVAHLLKERYGEGNDGKGFTVEILKVFPPRQVSDDDNSGDSAQLPVWRARISVVVPGGYRHDMTLPIDDMHFPGYPADKKQNGPTTVPLQLTRTRIRVKLAALDPRTGEIALQYVGFEDAPKRPRKGSGPQKAGT